MTRIEWGHCRFGSIHCAASTVRADGATGGERGPEGSGIMRKNQGTSVLLLQFKALLEIVLFFLGASPDMQAPIPSSPVLFSA
ncbi:hypothetical protein RRG08_022279 [Elysia crispata]|uniref:Uncharacterized protein n=1 Tax=Elysia crispata TaxID=231223 RepID=A0AAE0ZQB2_9GAST|nr:hypothetical protein RRG08_022279 [Elysia crispata]